MRADRVKDLSTPAQGRPSMIHINHLGPKDPTQVPDGDLGDAVKPGNPTPSDFNDDAADDEDLFDEADDETVDAGDDDE